jgi:hypothetical protein
MLFNLSNATAVEGEEVDTNRFVGAYYRVSVKNGFVSVDPPPSFVAFKRPSEEDIDRGNRVGWGSEVERVIKPGKEPLPY